MQKVELLSPAKNYETAIEAINCGADAIYIGAMNYGARHNAPNSLDDIQKIVNYAHLFNVKVFVTLNTILYKNELDEVIKLIFDLYNIKVDAIIVQDMSIINLAIMGKLPPIDIHASTQCNNRTVDKAKFFDNIGLSRVILARELSLNKIKDIVDNVHCEIETFIHGALCVSYSGQCYLSYANGFRSANRGECAQPCRKKYSLVDKNGKYLIKNKYLLSMKDFNASDYIKNLVDIGVKSFKIEGRLKDTNYVKNVTLYYNNLLNKYANRTSSGKVYTEIQPNVYKTFNRGYTTYFLDEREQCYNFLSPKSRGEKIGKVINVTKNYFEIDAKLNNQDGLCFIKNGKMFGCLVNKVDGNRVYPNNIENIEKDMVIYRNFDVNFDKLLSNSKVSRKIVADIIFNDNFITITDEDGNSAQIKLLDGDMPKNYEKLENSFKQQFEKSGDSIYLINSIQFNTKSLKFIPISKINALRRELLSKLDELRLNNYKCKAQQPLKYSNYITESIDYRGNVLNDIAEDFYNKCSCCIKQRAIESSKILPNHIELMRTKHCLKYATGNCGESLPPLFLEDENGKKYPLKFDCKNCEMVIYNN